jgi:8-oxo-dGTP pyrophosphatase MutT (NUDIX family)
MTGEELLLRESIRALAGEQNAACVYIARGGRVLAVSRKHDPNDMGLPGGKVESGETAIEAAVRELREETGYVVSVASLTPVMTRRDADGYTTTTFAVDWADVDGVINTTEQGRVRWVTWDELCAGSFGEYNRILRTIIGD